MAHKLVGVSLYGVTELPRIVGKIVCIGIYRNGNGKADNM